MTDKQLQHILQSASSTPSASRLSDQEFCQQVMNNIPTSEPILRNIRIIRIVTILLSLGIFFIVSLQQHEIQWVYTFLASLSHIPMMIIHICQSHWVAISFFTAIGALVFCHRIRLIG